MYYILVFGFILILFGFILFVIDAFFIKDKEKKLSKNVNNKFCILIPARDESNVIENLIVSIEKQSVNIDMKDVYVIVESEKDKTVSICKKHGFNCFVRKKLNLKSKGYALMEIIDYLYKNKKLYDLYFIFDADNVLDKNYFNEMLKSYKKGYDVCTGYRKSSNVNKNVISTCSALTFSLINNLLNINKISKNRTITISGTGYYISSKIMNNFKTFPFHLMTEDYEFSVYLSLNKFTTFYNTKAIFYDEQPTSFKESIKQRNRWCFGYLQTRKKYRNELRKYLNIVNVLGEYIGVKPYVLMLIGVLLIYVFLFLKATIISYSYLIFALMLTFMIYVVLMWFTILLIIVDTDLEINNKNKIKAILYNPIFLISYIYCMLKAIFGNVGWEKIEHKGEKI